MEPSLVTGQGQARAAALAAESTDTSRKIASDFDTFLRMLTVQMQNQDPLNPIESSDYAVQLATFSGVEQQVQTNNLLNALLAQMGVSGMTELAGWVGHEARAPVSAMFNGSPITISPNPVADADRVELIVRDSSGLEVQRSVIPASAEPIEWVGTTLDNAPLPNGLYSFVVESTKDGEVVASSQAEVYATVREIRSEGGQTVLVFDGGQTVPVSSVTALRM